MIQTSNTKQKVGFFLKTRSWVRTNEAYCTRISLLSGFEIKVKGRDASMDGENMTKYLFFPRPVMIRIEDQEGFDT